MVRSLFTVLGIVLLVAGPAAAEDAAKVDSHLAAALDVMDATNAKANLMVMIDSVGGSMFAQIKQSHPGASEKTLAAFQTAFKQEMTDQSDQLMKMQAAIYAEHFSENDLKALAAFYRSDVGKRFISEQPAIIKEVTPLAIKWGMEAGHSAAQHAIEKLKKEGITL